VFFGFYGGKGRTEGENISNTAKERGEFKGLGKKLFVLKYIQSR